MKTSDGFLRRSPKNRTLIVQAVLPSIVIVVVVRKRTRATAPTETAATVRTAVIAVAVRSRITVAVRRRSRSKGIRIKANRRSRNVRRTVYRESNITITAATSIPTVHRHGVFIGSRQPAATIATASRSATGRSTSLPTADSTVAIATAIILPARVSRILITSTHIYNSSDVSGMNPYTSLYEHTRV